MATTPRRETLSTILFWLVVALVVTAVAVCGLLASGNR